MKHAWLIIAHNQFGILQRLVSLLDDERSDFFIHIDKKVRDLPNVHVDHGHVYFLSNRIDVRWGTYSQIQAEMALFSTAMEKDTYDYFHIISGTTLPLKSIDEIDAYFEKLAGKSTVIGLCKDDPYQETLKIHRYNLFTRNYASNKPFRRQASQFLWKSGIAIQRLLGIRINRDSVFYKASNWVSLSRDAVQHLLSRRDAIEKTYRYSFCGDEYFVPSELMASPSFKDCVINDEFYLKHNIGRSNAETLRLEDFPALRQSQYLFARKFAQ
jgi:hypothetical protein